jgi:hypothetical protein
MQAQWIGYQAPGVPRLKDGKVNLAAKAPRLNGKPDLSGVWHVQSTPMAKWNQHFGPDFKDDNNPIGMELNTVTIYGIDAFADGQFGTEPMRPAAAEILKRRLDPNSTDVLRSTHCLPMSITVASLLSEPIKFVQSPTLTMILHEFNNDYRQIYTDGRKLPVDPWPATLGYSVGHWDGDTFVIESSGFKAEGWLDVLGHPNSEALKFTERYHRRDFGHLDAEYTFDDPVMYTKPFGYKVTFNLLPEADLFEYTCLENEKDKSHMGLK